MPVQGVDSPLQDTQGLFGEPSGAAILAEFVDQRLLTGDARFGNADLLDYLVETGLFVFKVGHRATT